VYAAQSATPTPQPESSDQPGLQQADLSTVSGNIQRPNGMFWHEGLLYVSCTGDWTLYRINPDTGDTLAYIYGVKNANMLYVETEDELASLWIPDFQSNSLVQVDRGGITPIATIETPWGIAPIDAERFAITSTGSNSVKIVTRDGAITDFVTGLRSPTGVAVENSMIYIANSGSARRAIEWVALTDEGDSAESDPPQPLVTGIQNVTNLVVGPDGMLYIAYALGTRGVVGRVDQHQCREQGGCSSRDVEIVLYTELAAPLAGLTITDDMQLFVHTIYSPDIYSVQLADPAAR
jgi:hypothetical protein